MHRGSAPVGEKRNKFLIIKQFVKVKPLSRVVLANGRLCVRWRSTCALGLHPLPEKKHGGQPVHESIQLRSRNEPTSVLADVRDSTHHVHSLFRADLLETVLRSNYHARTVATIGIRIPAVRACVRVGSCVSGCVCMCAHACVHACVCARERVLVRVCMRARARKITRRRMNQYLARPRPT